MRFPMSLYRGKLELKIALCGRPGISQPDPLDLVLGKAPRGFVAEVSDQRRHDECRAAVGWCDLGLTLTDCGRKLGL
jgi:hypothetical protein